MIAGIGCDLTPVERLVAACTRHPALLARLFTAEERAAADAMGRARWERLAGTFAAKEAAMKALGTGMHGVRWQDFEVRHAPSGQPYLVLGGAAAQVAAARGVLSLHVSISHAGGMAMATVVAEAGPAGPGDAAGEA